MWWQNSFTILEKYNYIEKFQTKAIYSQFLHMFSLYVDLDLLFYMERISLAGKEEAVKCSP